MAVLRKIFSSLRKLFGRPAPAGRRKKRQRKTKRKAPSQPSSPRRKPASRARKKLVRRPRHPASVSSVSPGKVKASSAKVQPLGQPVGEITHFFSKIQVAVVKMTKGNLSVGDRVRILGRSTDFTQTARSMQVESVDVRSARRGQLIGLKVEREARVGDKLHRLV